MWWDEDISTQHPPSNGGGSTGEGSDGCVSEVSVVVGEEPLTAPEKGAIIAKVTAQVTLCQITT